METPTIGAFTVLLHSLTWHRNVEQTQTIERSMWIFVQLVLPPEQPLKHVWFSTDDDNLMSKDFLVSAQSDEQTISLDYSQGSRALPLTTESMQELVHAQLLLSLYCGTTRTRTTDTLLSKTAVPLRTILLDEKKARQTVTLTSLEETFSIELDVQRNVAMADFLLGTKVLQLQSPRVLNLPMEWTARGCASNEAALAFCASMEQNTANYGLEIALPQLDNERVEGGVSPYEFDVVTIEGGKLHFEPVEEAAHISAADEDAQEERHNEALSGVWSVQFPLSTIIFVACFKSSVERLIEFLMVEKHIRGTLRRSPRSPTNGKVLDSITAELCLHVHELLMPGVAHISSIAHLRTISPVSRAFLEHELATAASNDDKKKLQSALADHENTMQRAASLTAAVVAAGTQVTVIADILPTSLVLQPPHALETPSKSIEELIPSHDWDAENEARQNIRGDLQTEIRLVVASLLREYEEVFYRSSDKKQESDDCVAASRDEKKRILIYRLNTQGAYHSFKEAFKKRIVPIIRETFARSKLALEANQEDALVQLDEKSVEDKKKEHFGQLYTLFMQEVNAILHETFYSDPNAQLEKARAMAEGHPTLKEMQSVLQVLHLKAMENEVSGDVEKCEMLHLDRIAYVEQHAASFHSRAEAQKLVETGTTSASQQLVDVWYDYARFCVAQAKLEKAGAALQQCLRFDAHAIEALIALVAVQCDLQDFARAEMLVKNAVVEARTCALSDSVDGARRVGLTHALLAFSYSQYAGKDPTGNLTLFELLEAQQVLQKSSRHKHISCTSAVWIFLAEYASEWKLWGFVQRILQLADSCLKPRDVISSELRVVKRAMEAELCLRDGADGGDGRAVKLLQEALEIDSSHPLAWFALGKVYLCQESQTKTAIECFQRALEHRRALSAESLKLELHLRLGLTLLDSAQFEMAETSFQVACEEFRVASCWLGVGIACLRLERWERAEMALAEANRLDFTNPDVWGYLALLSLSAHASVSARDEKDAHHFVSQALQHNLTSPALLRELSNAFVAIDRLESAVKLLRRSLACQDSSLTRKTLADVLAAQNCAEDALRQYTQLLDEVEGIEERCALLEKCAQLLVTLGRPEEATEYRTMATQFQADSG